MQSSPTRKTKAERKRELWDKDKIPCHICPFHRGDNNKRRPREDRYKNHRRS